MDRAQPVEAVPDLVGQSFVRTVHVGEQRVAADVGDDASAEDRTERRLGSPRHVAVPGVLASAVPLVVLDQQDLAVFLVLRCHRMDLEVAEIATEVEMLLRGDRLLAEEEHLVLQQTGAQRRDRRLVERLAEVDVADLGTDRRAQPIEADGVHVHAATASALELASTQGNSPLPACA